MSSLPRERGAHGSRSGVLWRSLQDLPGTLRLSVPSSLMYIIYPCTCKYVYLYIYENAYTHFHVYECAHLSVCLCVSPLLGVAIVIERPGASRAPPGIGNGGWGVPVLPRQSLERSWGRAGMPCGVAAWCRGPPVAVRRLLVGRPSSSPTGFRVLGSLPGHPGGQHSGRTKIL